MFATFFGSTTTDATPFIWVSVGFGEHCRASTTNKVPFLCFFDIGGLVDGSQNSFGPPGTALKLKNGTFLAPASKENLNERVFRARSMLMALEGAEMALEGHLLVIGTSLKPHSGRFFCLVNEWICGFNPLARRSRAVMHARALQHRHVNHC